MPTQKAFCLALSAMLILASSAFASGQSKGYPDGRGGEITLPNGDLSFADRVVSFAEGSPASRIEESQDPENALGAPTHRGQSAGPEGFGSFITLGCHGSLILEFVDNALIDIAGADLHVWEVGPDVEPTTLAISRNGDDWMKVGAISGGTASVDIAEVAGSSESFRFVRLTDTKCQGTGGRWPGADIDAVAAVGTAERFVFDSAVLFDSDSATLREEAREVLMAFADQLAEEDVTSMRIEGHSDSVGDADYNTELSLRRAVAVKEFLKSIAGVEGIPMESGGLGESEPVASNETELGRQQNRRVEVLVVR